MNSGKNNHDNKITLKVAETNPKFVGRGVALVDPKVMEGMALSTGDVIEISAKKKSYVLLWSSQSEDYGKGLIRIDGYTRHTKKKPLDSDVNLDKLVQMTNRMTGADIAAIVNAAAITAIKEHISKSAGELKLSMRHFEAALNKIKTGGSKGDRIDLKRLLPTSASLTQIPASTHT